MKTNKFFFVFCLVVVSTYFIYGLFFPDIPRVKPDEHWEISRANYLLKYHRPGDPMFPAEISPAMTSLYNATWGNRYFGIIKTGSQAFFISLFPVNNIYAIRLGAFTWSLLVCFLTYKLALKTGLTRNSALLSSILLVATPEFFIQVHSHRPEMMVTAAYLTGLLLFIYILKMENGWKKMIFLFLSAIYGWVVAFTIHPNAIVIPAAFGVMYLSREYKKIFSVPTFVFGLTLIAGACYFNYLMKAPAHQSVLEGGADLLQVQGRPPIVRMGAKIIFALPVIFYKKFYSYNEFIRPVCTLFFVVSCISFFFLFKKKKTLPAHYHLDILGTGIIVPLLILLLLSGSNAHFNIICFPLAAILIAAAVHEFVFVESKKKIPAIITCCFFILFLSGFKGLSQEKKLTEEYKRITNEANESITDKNAIIMGNAIFYNGFKDRVFYSLAALSPSIGKPGQSFEEAVRTVHAGYLIIDEEFVRRIKRARGEAWINNMFIFLNDNCEAFKEIEVDQYFLHSKKPGKISSQPYDKEMDFYKKIKIYKVL